jgi:Family of unknown function (DUF6519)
MKGDFSRIRFNPAKNYTAVLEQQGRVALDADANERSAIEGHLRGTTNIDVIGSYGGPMGDAGFAINALSNDILIEPGRYYVRGILVESASEVHYDNQPFLIDPTYSAQQLLEAVQQGGGQVTAQLTLEVWQRLVTRLDDPCLVEPALGQADTTARLQTVWRVVGTLSGTPPPPPPPPVPVPGGPISIGVTPVLFHNLEEVKARAATRVLAPAEAVRGPARKQAQTQEVQAAPVAEFKSSLSFEADSAGPLSNAIDQLSPCCQGLYSPPLVLRTGAMAADTGLGNNECGCQPIPSAGYQGLENQLYRVEIHQGGTMGTATFKWSRENGSVVAHVMSFSGPVVTASSLGPDANLGFQAGQWVELTDDANVFGEPPNQPGQLYQIQSLGPGPLQVTLAQPVAGIDTTRNARMRRWDQSGAEATAQGVALSSVPTQLENGIEVTFQPGIYQPGDYWTIPARTADGSIDWPPCGSDGNFFQPAKFIQVYSAPLACIHLRTFANNLGVEEFFFSPFVVDDCRLQFPPLSALAQEQPAAALHVQSVSWANDDVLTIDVMLQQGVFVVFDNPPSCPWGGGNFQVTIEVPFAGDPLVSAEGSPGFPPKGNFPPGTDVFMRTVMTLDPPLGITVSGNQVNWILPEVIGNFGVFETYYLYVTLNNLLKSTAPLGFARIRVRLLGEGVYGDSPNGNMYLDGSSFGATSARNADGSPCVSLNTPSGNLLKASDFESWFYLAPSLLIANATIQLMNEQSVVGSNNVTVGGSPGSINLSVTGSNPTTPVTAVNAVITFTYPPVAATTVSLSLVDISGNAVSSGNIVTIQGSAPVSPGQLTVTVPVNIVGNPGVSDGVPIIDTVGLNVSVPGLFSALPFGGTQPTLIITGSETFIIFGTIQNPFTPTPPKNLI